jgi:hypothetical protein
MTKKLLLGILFVALLAIAPVATKADGSPIPPFPPHGRTVGGGSATTETAIDVLEP